MLLMFCKYDIHQWILLGGGTSNLPHLKMDWTLNTIWVIIRICVIMVKMLVS